MQRFAKATWLSGPSRLLLILIVILGPTLFISGSAGAQDKSASTILNRVQQLEKRLSSIEADQRAILEKQEKILEELKTLRIWIRRN